MRIKHCHLLFIRQQFIYQSTIHLFHFIQESICFKAAFFCVKHPKIIYVTFGNDITSRSYITVCIQNLFLCSDMLPFFIIKHISGSYFFNRFFFDFSFTVDQMNVIIGLCLIVMKSRNTGYSIGYMKLLCKQFQQHVWVQFYKIFRKCNHQFSCFNAFPLCSAHFKIMLILFAQKFPTVI